MARTAGVDVIFGDVIASITQSGGRVEVTFRDGDARTFDLVVGADGLHSNVRRRVVGDEFQYLRDLGMYLCLLGAQLPAPRPDGGAVFRGRPNRGDLEHP